MISIDINNMSQYDAFIPKNRPIVHLTLSPLETKPEIISKLENDLDCQVEICNSWPALVIRMSVLANAGCIPPLLVVDSDIIQNKSLTVSEISNMMSVIYKCMVLPDKMRFAVIITQPCDIKFIKELQNSDIKGIIPRENQFGYERVLETIKELLTGRMCWPKDVISAVTNTPTSDKKVNSTELTRRQADVFNLVSKRGLSNKKIAATLGISESTVKLHMGVILKKYRVTNRTQLAVFSGSV